MDSESSPMKVVEKNKKRNVWTTTEVRYFLELVKEKHILGLMDGKRLRVGDIFKTLVGPMKEQGYIRDAPQLIVKYKNLKSEYYKCKRHNNISGNSPKLFEFFDEMDELLGQRPISLSQGEETGFESLVVPLIENVDDGILDAEIEGVDVPHDLAAPGPSNRTERNKKGKKDTQENAFLKVIKEMEEMRKMEAAEERTILTELMLQHENTMKSCTKFFLNGLGEMLTGDTERVDSDSE